MTKTNLATQLDLTFLATGTWQHVFVRTGVEADGWVYKIPAAFGYILPFDHMQRYKPEKFSAKRLGYALAHFLLGSRVIAAHLKHLSSRNFEAMLKLIAEMERDGLSDILLPCQLIRDGAATLRVGENLLPYRGAILMQRRADYLFEKSENLRAIEWRELVQAHHRLWRHGITFSTPTAVLGLKNWGLLEGRLQLFDTSSLTRDPQKVRRVLSHEALDRREETLIRQAVEKRSSEPIEEYFHFIRQEINREKLDQLWRASLSTKG